ncbi:hypothetical protein BDZ94DRAFT_1233257 [Collybia nuda]|uniref:Ribonuclease H1 N-terminal domain-containing protein n=1 Tax=Collybia nuda TaxID=64659 RepID=A0A9P5YE91_9AGAR|nr:hypothetical protein BDZ94DRAFT_1233257 [Collybia nuda]
MTQFPNERVGGSAPAIPATLSLADLLQVLALAGITLRVGTADSEPVLPEQPLNASHTPLTPTNTPPPPATGSNVVTPPPTQAMGSTSTLGVSGGVVTQEVGTDTAAQSGGGVAAGKARAQDIEGPCADCAARGCLPPPSEDDESGANGSGDSSVRWYSVTAGRHVGVFSHWSFVAPLVVHVSGAVFVKCSSRAAAEAAFALSLAAGAVHVIE